MVRHGIALRAHLPLSLIDHVLAAHSAKGVTALAWKAGCTIRFASQLQLRLGGIAPSQVLNPRGGSDYPLSPEEMDWQLDFFQKQRKTMLEIARMLNKNAGIAAEIATVGTPPKDEGSDAPDGPTIERTSPL